MHLRNVFRTKHSAALQIFLPDELSLEGQWEVAFSK